MRGAVRPRVAQGEHHLPVGRDLEALVGDRWVQRLAAHFETKRTDAEPDVAALEKALTHALEARRRNPTYGEAWATLGFVLERVGRRDDALAAARQSIVLEPDNWRHHLRLSAASWGEERLREARRTLHLLPGLPMAHWLAASVLTARGLLTEAEEELRIGLAHPSSPFGCVALHWLLGLVLWTRGARSDAIDAWHRELDEAQSGHLYATEVAANAWYAIGATRVAAGDRTGAQAAWLECVRRVPTHLLARAALGSAGLGSAGLGSAPPARGPSGVDRAIAQAIYLASGDDRAESHGAAPVVERALAEAPAGNAGWLLPVEPMLAIASCPAPWLGVLAWLRSRAA